MSRIFVCRFAVFSFRQVQQLTVNKEGVNLTCSLGIAHWQCLFSPKQVRGQVHLSPILLFFARDDSACLEKGCFISVLSLFSENKLLWSEKKYRYWDVTQLDLDNLVTTTCSLSVCYSFTENGIAFLSYKAVLYKSIALIPNKGLGLTKAWNWLLEVSL